MAWYSDGCSLIDSDGGGGASPRTVSGAGYTARNCFTEEALRCSGNVEQLRESKSAW